MHPLPLPEPLDRRLAWTDGGKRVSARPAKEWDIKEFGHVGRRPPHPTLLGLFYLFIFKFIYVF